MAVGDTACSRESERQMRPACDHTDDGEEAYTTLQVRTFGYSTPKNGIRKTLLSHASNARHTSQSNS